LAVAENRYLGMKSRQPKLEKTSNECPNALRAPRIPQLGFSTLVLVSCACVWYGSAARGEAPSWNGSSTNEITQPGGGPSLLADSGNKSFVSSFSPSFSTPEAPSGSEREPTNVPPASPLEAVTNGCTSQPCGETAGAVGDPHRVFCEDCPKWGVLTFVGYDSWRGIADDSWQNNGIHVGANLGTWLGPVSEATGIGFQFGGSVGVYDWSGAEYRPRDSAVETQGFITYGFFRKPNQNSKWSAGVVQDWMLNNNFGVYSQNPTLSQIRAQLGYAFTPSNEIGLWGACRVLSDTNFVSGVGSTTWRPIDQLNLYWHHKWELAGADTSVWIGLPEQDRLGGSGSLGEYIAGASANIPLSNSFALYTLVTYMHPSAGPGGAGSTEDEWSFAIGLAFYPGRNARSTTVAGQCWMPLMPVANNGYFLVDTNHH
jgi:hypothetical protein